jgi:hypothetical protein
MRYALLIDLDEPQSQARPPADIQAAMAAHVPYIETLRKNGKYVRSDALSWSRSARTLRNIGGKPVVTEGPFAESREQFGGFYVIEARDLDEAIDLASKCPALSTRHDHISGLEIRPTRELAAGPTLAGHVLVAYGSEGADREREDDAPPMRGVADRLRETGREWSVELFSPASSATSLRARNGKIKVSDGPLSARGGQMAGLFIVPRGSNALEDLASAFSDTGLCAVEERAVREGDS